MGSFEQSPGQGQPLHPDEQHQAASLCILLVQGKRMVRVQLLTKKTPSGNEGVFADSI